MMKVITAIIVATVTSGPSMKQGTAVRVEIITTLDIGTK